MSNAPFAKQVPYSSIVGGGITIHSEPDCRGPVLAQLALLNVFVAPGEDHRKATERVASIIVEAINEFGHADGRC